MAFENVVPERWIPSIIVPLYKGEGERAECKNYSGISVLCLVGKIYAGITVDRLRRVTEGPIDDEEEDM